MEFAFYNSCKLILIELKQGLILVVIIDTHWGLWVGGGLPIGLWQYDCTPFLNHDLSIEQQNASMKMKFNKFLSPNQATKKFDIKKGEFLAWTSICQQMVGIGGRLCQQAQSNPSDNDWFGLYNQPTDHTLQFVI